MMARLANPSLRWIGGLFACAAVLLLVSTWMINSSDPDIAAYAFPPMLIGLVFLFAALAQLALWALNRGEAPPSV
jgi:hypothetical protein